MKKLIITLLSALLILSMSVTPCMAAGEIVIPGKEVIEITSTNFPDNTFRGWVASSVVDIDQDGWLDQAEIDAVTEVTNQYSGFDRMYQYVLPDGIENLKGFEVFTNIQTIIFDIVSIGSNQYNSININNLNLTNFSELKTLYLRDDPNSNQWAHVASLDLSYNTKLKSLRIGGLGITSLNASGQYIEDLGIDYTNIAQLDLSKYTNLKYFWSIDSKLKSWTATNATSNLIESLYISGQDFQDTTIDVSKYSALERLTISDCNVGKIVGLSNCTKLTDIDCSRTKISDLDISGLNRLVNISCSWTNVRTLDLSGKKNLEYLNCGGALESITNIRDCVLLSRVHISGCSKLNSIDLSDFKYLEEFNLFGGNQGYSAIGSVNLSGCSMLNNLSIDGCDVDMLDISDTNVLGANLYNNTIDKIKCTNCNLYYLDVGETTAIVNLNLNPLIVYSDVDNIRLNKSRVTNPVGLISNGNDTYSLDSSSSMASYDYTVKTSVVMHVTVNMNGAALTDISINASNFPDPLFRQYVRRYDIDNDNKLSLSERQDVYNIGSVGGVDSLDTGTKSIEGIEFFPNLDTVIIDDTAITSLDVSKNTKLAHLYARETGLSTIDVSGNTLLSDLRLSGTNISRLDLSKNNMIKYLDLANTQIKSIDVTNCLRLVWIYLYGNTKVSELDLSNNLYLEGFDLPDSLLALDLPNEFVEFKSYGKDDLKTTISMTLKKNQTSIDLKNYAPYIVASRITKVKGSPTLSGTEISNITNGSTLEYKYSANKTFDLDVTIRFEVPGNTNPGQRQGRRTTTDPVVEPGGDVSVNISNSAVTTTDNGKTYTTTTLNNNQVTDIIKAAENSNSDKVVINASTNTSTDVAQVVVPTEFFKRVDNKLGASVSIQTDTGAIVLDPETVKSIAKDAKGGNVQLAIAKSGDDYKATYNISISAGGKELHTFNGGSLEITVALPKKLVSKDVSAIYTDSDGNVGPVAGTTNSDGTYTFKTNHLSSYSVVSETDANKLMKSTAKKYLKGVKLKTVAKANNNHKVVVNAKISAKNSNVKKLAKLGYTKKYKYYRSTNNKKYKHNATKSANKYTYTKSTKGKTYYYKTKLVICDTEGNAIASTSLANCKLAKVR